MNALVHSKVVLKTVSSFISLFEKREILRFIITGFINTAFSYICFFILSYLGFHYSITVLFAYGLGIVFNFQTARIIVFKDRRNSRLFNFIFVYAITYSINVFLLYLLVPIIADPRYAQAIVVIPIAGLTYLMQKRFVFKA